MKIWILLLASACISCNNQTQNTNTTTNDTTTADTIVQQPNETFAGCYLAVKGHDTIRLQLNVTDSLVSGQMQYDNFGIDGNIGTINGVLRQGRISGYFRFLSEGMWSVREVAFEEKSGQLLQASTAAMQYSGDTAKFTEPVVWDTARPFTRVPCSQLVFPPMPATNL